MHQDPEISPPPPPPPLPVPVAADQLTRQEIAGIRAAREELSNQLESAAGRREDLVEELRMADEVTRSGLEQRIAVLDQRIVQLELDIAETGRQLTSAPGGLVEGTAPAFADGELGGLGPGQVTAISIVFTLFVLFPLAIALARLIWKRAMSPVRPALPTEAVDRLDRLEQAVDTVAVEMERVSEGQRFMTRLLTEPNALAVLEANQLSPALAQREPQLARARPEGE
ncbi:MAG: hypothetical protein ACRENI_02305 [Gemmatimonadaceae bacterium]